MLAQLGKQICIALLAVSLITAPVFGSMSRCCQTGALAGSGNCCCGPHTPTADTPACCVKPRANAVDHDAPAMHDEDRPACCRAATELPEPVSHSADACEISLQSAPCSCQQGQHAPALTNQSKRDKSESIEFSLCLELDAAAHVAIVVRHTVHPTSPAAPPGVPLRVALCRWTI